MTFKSHQEPAHHIPQTTQPQISNFNERNENCWQLIAAFKCKIVCE